MTRKVGQISVRLPADLDEWLEQRAGGKREKPAFIQRLLERERRLEDETRLQAMFDAAWDSLSAEDREQVQTGRDEWLRAHSARQGA